MALRKQRFFSLGELNEAIAKLLAQLHHGIRQWMKEPCGWRLTACLRRARGPVPPRRHSGAFWNDFGEKRQTMIGASLSRRGWSIAAHPGGA